MKRIGTALLIAALAAAPLAAQLEVIRSAPYRGLAPLDLAIDGRGVIWVPDLYEGLAYLFDLSLNPLGTVPCPAGQRLYTGLAWNSRDETLWWIDSTENLLYRTGTDGALLSSFPLPAGASISGVTYAAGLDTFWCLDPVKDEVFEITVEGIRTAAPAVPLPTGAESFGLGITWVGDPVTGAGLDVLCGGSEDGAARYLARLAATGEEAPCLRREFGVLGEFLGGIAWHPAPSDGLGSFYVLEIGSREIMEVRATGSPSVCPPAGIACEAGNASVELSWEAGTFESIEVWRNGGRIAVLEGSALRYEDGSPPLGEMLLYQVIGVRGVERSAPALCEIAVPAISPPSLPRTDAFGHAMRWAPDLSFASLGDTAVPLPSGDDGSAEVLIGFPFTFYGTTFDRVSVGANGLLAFGGPAAEPANTSIPSLAGPEGLIAPFWDDLEVLPPASVKTGLSGSPPSRRFTVEWLRAQIAPADQTRPTADLRFQVVLHETSGEIDIIWGDLRGPRPDLAHGASATVGIESPDGSDGILFSFREIAVSERSAVRIALGPIPPNSRFLRGDANADGSLDVSDPIRTVLFLFQTASALSCREAADSNDDDAIDLTDPIHALRYLFLQGGAPPSPFSPTMDAAACGDDPTPPAPPGEGLGCESFAPCQGKVVP